MYKAKELMDLVCENGTEKLKRRIISVFIASILGGLFIGLGYLGYLYLAFGPFGNKFFGSLIFATGLVMIIIGGADLFTGNCLLTFGVLSRRYSFGKMGLYLLLVWIGNFVGAFLLALMVKFANVDQIMPEIIALSKMKINLSFWEAFFRGVLCNILVAMAVYMAGAAKNVSGKILACILPVSLFVVSGFEHSVANMFLLPLGSINGGDFSFLNTFINLIPVTLGNFLAVAFCFPGLII